MSHQYYNQKWQDGISDLNEITNIELNYGENLVGLGAKEKRDDVAFKLFTHSAHMYIKYIEIYKKLEECFDQMVHPQKRILLKEMLENTMGRLCELKQEMINQNVHHRHPLSHFINLDEIILDLKLTPTCLELHIPRYFRETTEENILKRNQLLDKKLIEFWENAEPEGEELVERSKLDASFETAVRILQKNERGRQGIERSITAKYLKNEEKKRKMRIEQDIGTTDDTEREDAVRKIQKYYRGYKGREEVYFERQKEMLFLGMKKADYSEEVEQQKKVFKEQERRMKMIQNQNFEEYQKSLKELKQLVLENEGPDLKDKFYDERMKWIYERFERSKYKDLPLSVEEFYEEMKDLMPLTAEEQEQKRLEEEQKAKADKNKKDAGKKNTGKPSKAKKSDAEEFDAMMKPKGPVKTVKEIQTTLGKYANEWAKRDESKNYQQKHVTDLAKKIVIPEVEEEIKKNVDELIPMELANLRNKYNLKKPSGKGRGRGGKGGGKGGRGGRGDKPKKVPGAASCKNRDPQDMLAELVEANVAKKLVPAKIGDLMGGINVLGAKGERQLPPTKEDPEFLPDPSFLLLRQLLIEYIAIPLGSLRVKEWLAKESFLKEEIEKNKRPIHYFLFYGPVGSGKTLGIRALAYECNALVLDISQSNLETRYSDPNSTKKLLYMVFTVAKAFQPAIIMCDEIETIFKKGKKGGRMKKPLMEFQKAKYLEEHDRVAFIACTNRPNETNVKDLEKFFFKQFYFPFPDYSSRLQIFRSLVETKGQKLPENFPLSSLAHITEGYSAGSFKLAIDKVLTERRIKMIKERPLTIHEFIIPLSATPYTYPQDRKKFNEFNDEVTGLGLIRSKRFPKVNEKDDPKKKTAKGGKK